MSFPTFKFSQQIKAPHQLEHISSAEVGSPSNSRTPCEKNMSRSSTLDHESPQGSGEKMQRNAWKFHHPGCFELVFSFTVKSILTLLIILWVTHTHVCLHLRLFFGWIREGCKNSGHLWPYPCKQGSDTPPIQGVQHSLEDSTVKLVHHKEKCELHQ